MQCLLLLAVAIAGILADPMQGYNEDERYFYVAGDGDHTLHLVDSEEPADLEFIEEYISNPANTVYWLFTRKNPSSYQVLTLDDATSIRKSNFRYSRITVFLVHGSNGNGKNSMNMLLTEAFLQNADVNVIVVDWNVLANKSYNTAKAGTAEVGRGLGQFINWLVGLGMSYDSVHLVGFSLGAHLVGNAGRATGGQVERITGLDPAGPRWYFDHNRLAPTDGKYVEVIHTDTGLLGYRNPCGHADFYPNGGTNMPGCVVSTCSHSRAYEYMASSVKYNHLLAKECASLRDATHDRCSGTIYPMGNSDILKSRKGIFRVNTGKDYPY